MEIVHAELSDVAEIVSILNEAAKWLIDRDEMLWDPEDLVDEKIAPDVRKGLYWIAVDDGQTVGCLRYQNEDPEYWDDVPHEDSAFIHRVAVKRKFAGQKIPLRMIDWAKKRAQREGKSYLRLDCGDRPKLRAVYESMGFEYHSVKARSPYNVIRYEFDLKKID